MSGSSKEKPSEDGTLMLGGEFKSTEVTAWLKSIGIAIETMVPHQHQQNSRAECSI